MADSSILPIEFVDLKKQRARIGAQIDSAIQRVLTHGQFILGPEVRQFEDGLKSFCGAKHAVACSNGTDAIGLSLMALKVRPGDVVIVPAFTFAATAEVVAWMGATPIFADSLPDTFNIDPASIEAATKTAKDSGLRPVGVIAVDLFGLPADYDRIEKICDANGMWLICDSAQGFGGTYKGRTTGSIGKITTTSFFPAKPLGCYGDGGAIFTDDDEIAATLQSLRFHGKGADKYDNVRIGMNARLDTLQAAILIEKLAIYKDEIDRRNLVADAYTRQLSDVVQTPRVPAQLRSVWAQYTLTLAPGTDRAALAAALKDKGIPSAVYYPKPLHRQTAYSKYPVAGNGIPVCEDLAGRVISLPMHPYLSDAQIDFICTSVREALKNPAQAAA
ncbi:MAG: DegT/DnrJ/EryC1/StrS family aminotransferase [Rhodospirillales bacterium]|nr:DegT/DnrJ/EryC1/StrS family aminotransferase [Alphaproteobacteria bacterium]MCB9986274.1 DegT/DnrJ/EryC1/StrS family aminotransferase [Rhodospirillales bacterium]USO07173.1 MAG: DegT/DnrJ/EryC1/StrS family aminotransferase [Rhodospirillales bacterium]